MKKIRLRSTNRAMRLRVEILSLIVQKKFKEAKELASKYETAVGYDMINDYKEGMVQYRKIHSKKSK